MKKINLFYILLIGIILFSVSIVSATSNVTVVVDGIHTSGSIVGGDFVLEQVDLENAEVEIESQTYLTDGTGNTEAIVLEPRTYTFTISKEGYETKVLNYEIKANTAHMLGILLNPVEEICEENWQCTDWGECNKFTKGQSRECTDLNNCDNIIDKVPKPTQGQSCTPEVCSENWQCSSWSDCVSGQQTRPCTDSNSCGTTQDKPSISKSCNVDICDEDWDCTDWESCVNGRKIRSCNDGNNCGTRNNRPSTSDSCTSSEEEPSEEEMSIEKEEKGVEVKPPEEVKERNKVAKSSICNGCILENKCAPFGYRKEGEYCDIGGEFKEQKSSEGSCDNSYECSTNVCVNSKCISPNLIQKIINWFARLFGG